MADTTWVVFGAGALGAVIGGAFTAGTAIYQAKILLKATSIELSQGFRQERQLQREMHEIDVSTQTLKALTRIENLTWLNRSKHKHKNGVPDTDCWDSAFIAQLSRLNA